MNFEPKAVRKAVREVVVGYKRSMFGRRTCVDVGGRHWSLEYGVLQWREASKTWGEADWDDYSWCSGEREMMRDLADVAKGKLHVCVAVRLMCEHKVNEETRINIDGSKLYSL